MLLYRVKKAYARGSETIIADFKEINDARLFINSKLLEDARLKVQVIYRIFEGMDMVEELSEAQGGDISSAASSSGSQQRSSFQPTPFNSAPRPPGTPHSWVKDEEGGDKNK